MPLAENCARSWKQLCLCLSSFSRSLKTDTDLIENSPNEMTRPQRLSAIESQVEIGGKNGRVLQFETSAKRGDVVNEAVQNKRASVWDYDGRRKNTRACDSSSFHHAPMV